MTNQILSREQAYQAMYNFLRQYHQRIGNSGDLATLLSDMQIISDDDKPADPAMWGDWADAVRMVLEDSPH